MSISREKLYRGVRLNVISVMMGREGVKLKMALHNTRMAPNIYLFRFISKLFALNEVSIVLRMVTILLSSDRKTRM